MDFATVAADDLDFNDPPEMVWIPAQAILALLWIENPKRHDVGGLRASIRRHGVQELPKFDGNLPNVGGGMGALKSGNGRAEQVAHMENDPVERRLGPPRGAAVRKSDGAWVLPILVGTDAANRAEAMAYALDSNNLTMAGSDFTAEEMAALWDEGPYLQMVKQLAEMEALPETIDQDDADALIAMLGDILADGPDGPPDPPNPSLADRFIIPPFSVLDARQGYWRDRKERWLRLGLQGEVGRADTRIGALDVATAMQRGQDVDEVERKAGISVFDPVLAELCYRWFCPAGGLIVNPTAGESVYGIVAGMLGYAFHGIELRAEQVEANRAQALGLAVGNDVQWTLGDGAQVAEIVGEGVADFVLCCPPYYDLEVYSGDPDDLSTASTYDEFVSMLHKIIDASVRALKPDRFAAFVVGDIRDSDGYYRNFVADTTAGFLAAGCQLYNEAVLVTPVGSLAVHSGRQFKISRKLGKGHQNVLVYVKGDWRKAVAACGDITVDLPEELLLGQDI